MISSASLDLRKQSPSQSTDTFNMFVVCHSSPDDSDTFLHSSDQDIDLQPLNATCSYRGLQEVPAPAQPPDSRSRIAIQALTLQTHLPFFYLSSIAAT